jgi:hypothetical protein
LAKKIDFSLADELAALPGEPLELEEELHAASVTNPMAATASDADLRTDMDAPDGMAGPDAGTQSWADTEVSTEYSVSLRLYRALGKFSRGSR